MTTHRLLNAAALAAAGALSSFGPAMATNLVANGDFASGDFTGWTLSTTDNGALGPSPDPQVTSFNVGGGGAVESAEFQVGEVTPNRTEQGGSLSQSFTTSATDLHFRADVAASVTKYQNSEGGVFSVLLNGVTEDSLSFGATRVGRPDRGVLTFFAPVSAGVQTIEILMTRSYTDGGGYQETPNQYVGKVSAIAASAPEPASWALMLVGFAGLGGAIRSRRTQPAEI